MNPDKKPLGKAKRIESRYSGVVLAGKSDPKKNCKHCYGRGYIGFDTETGGFVHCKCVMRKKKEEDNSGKEKE